MSTRGPTPGESARLLVQQGTATGFDCFAFADVPTERPALVVCLAAPTNEARAQAAQLVAALRTTALDLGGTAVAAPCDGGSRSPDGCRLHDSPDWQRLLVLVGDDTRSFPHDGMVDRWIAGGGGYDVLPLLQLGHDAATAFPLAIQALNVGFWSTSAAECVDDVLARARVTVEERRVFISYRRADAAAIGEQLFEELSRHRFEPFFDVFSIAPGIPFLERLTDELARKSMVLVLESPGINDSRWVSHELAFAKKHDLGRLALELPGARCVPWLEDELRVTVDPGDLKPRAATVTARSTLTAPALARVMKRLMLEHTRAYLRRRGFLLDAVRAALNRYRATDQTLDSNGHLIVSVRTSDDRTMRYAIWTSPRPPEVSEFLRAHGVCHPGPEPAGAIVTTVLFGEARRRAESEWLSKVSLVQLTDEGRIDEMAERISRGEALC